MTFILRRPALAGFLALGLILSACSSSSSDQGASDDADPEASSAEGADQTDTTTSAEPTTSEPVDDSSDAASSGQEDANGDELFPDVLDATATQSSDGTWTVSATLSSPYDSPDRYADNWRVIGPDGTVYGERFLTHDHAGEQPFTRSQSGIEIPEDVGEVTIEGRDQVSGWGGGTFLLALPR